MKRTGVAGSDSEDVDVLMEASKLLTAVVARSLVQAGTSVTTPQLRVLVMLHGRADLNLTSVARALGLNASSASRTCEQLVTGGLVLREDDPADRRNLRLALTSEGQSLVDRLMEHRREAFVQIIAGMSVAARGRLSSGLSDFVASARQLSDGEQLPEDEGGLLRWLL